MEAQETFAAGMATMDSDKLVFIDEAGFSTALNFSSAWSEVGKPAVVFAPARADNLTVIGALARRGALAFKRLEGPLNAERFEKWLLEDLGPLLRPGDQVVMDNLRVHKMGFVSSALAKFGASVLYLPPYSPEFNPIELAWGICKGAVRAIAPRARHALEAILDNLASRFSADLCASMVGHCGYKHGST